MKLDINELIKFLNEKELNPTLEPNTGQIEVMMQVSKREVPLFFSVISEGLVLQSITYLPLELPEKHQADIARLLHVLNRQLDIPGFGMDEKHGVVFFRITLPSLTKEVAGENVELMIGSTHLACDSFLSAIEMIATGTVSLDKVMEEKNKQE